MGSYSPVRVLNATSRCCERRARTSRVRCVESDARAHGALASGGRLPLTFSCNRQRSRRCVETLPARRISLCGEGSSHEAGLLIAAAFIARSRGLRYARGGHGEGDTWDASRRNGSSGSRAKRHFANICAPPRSGQREPLDPGSVLPAALERASRSATLSQRPRDWPLQR